MNWWLASGWFVACLLIGLSIYRQHLNRVQEYNDWVGFCEHLHQGIGFALKPLPQIVTEYLPISHGNCRVVLNSYLSLLNNKIDLTRERCLALTSDVTIAEFFYQLGRTGRETEQDKITAVREIFLDKARQAKHELQSKASIMLKLLIIIGIAGGILWM